MMIYRQMEHTCRNSSILHSTFGFRFNPFFVTCLLVLFFHMAILKIQFTQIFISIWMQYVLNRNHHIKYIPYLPCMVYTFHHRSKTKKEIRTKLSFLVFNSISTQLECGCHVHDAKCVAQMLIGCSIKTSVFPAPTIIYYPKMLYVCVVEIYTIYKRLFYPFLYRNSRFDHILSNTKRLAHTD